MNNAPSVLIWSLSRKGVDAASEGVRPPGVAPPVETETDRDIEENV